MKTIILTLLFASLCLGSFDLSGAANEKKYIRFNEYIRNGSSSAGMQKIPQKSSRHSKQRGDIFITFGESVPDSMRVAVNVAKELWESNLPAGPTIYVTVECMPLEDDLAMFTEWAGNTEPALLGCPNALASQIKQFAIGTVESPDAFICFNTNTKWNCRFVNTEDDSYNVTTMALRGIAIGLGFGTSIMDIDDVLQYYFECPAYFDKLLQKDDIPLTSLDIESDEARAFVTSDKVVAKANSGTYKMYSPQTFEQYKSLVYLKEDNSLMSYTLGKGNSFFTVDSATKDILMTLGWNMPDSGFEISCSDIGEDGIGSSYQSHTFTLSSGNESVNNYNWTFSLKNSEGNFVRVKNGTANSFTIDNIESSDGYYVNMDGDLEGKVECEYSVRGKNYMAIPFSLSLELKPVIVSVDRLSVVNSGPYDFFVELSAQYRGADRMYVELEEEFNTSVRTSVYEEPFYAHIKTGTMNSLYYSWVTLIARNKYGEVYKTFEYEPKYNRMTEVADHSGIECIEGDEHTDTQVRVYSVQGNLVWEGLDSEFGKQDLPSGLYIKKAFDRKKGISVKKIIK